MITMIEPLILSAAAVSIFFFITLPLVEGLRGRELRQAWRKRLEVVGDFVPPLPFCLRIKTILGEINDFLHSIINKCPGQILYGWWQDAGFGSQPLPFLGLLIGIIGIGTTAGYFSFGSALLCVYFSSLLLLVFFVLLYYRAKAHRQLFQDQFPGVLGRLADSLQAGFSLLQAIEFMAPNLPEPSASDITRVFTQIQIGYSVEQALTALYHRYPNDDTRLLMEGITLQRQTGGDMIEMIREIAELVRQRVELEKEIRTLTSQGRLSAVVIALLVPVSLGILSIFPGYTDVLFETTIGNLILISAGVLEVIGALIVSRLIRIEV